MALAYSTNAYTRHGLIEAIERIAALGFDGVEILCDRPHWFPLVPLEGEVRRRAETLRRHLERLGLAVSNLNCNTANGFFDPLPPENVFEPSLSSANPQWRQWRLESCIQALDLAALLGGRNISLTSGRPESGGTPEQGLDLFVDSLKRLCDAAERTGIRIGVEYEPGLLVERAAELLEVIHRVGSPLLGANLDIGHSWLDGEPPEQALAMLSGRIWNTHLEDIRARKHFHLIPGEGDLPFQRYLDALDASGFEGFHTVELYTYTQMPDEAGRRSLDYLRPLLAGRAQAR